MVTDDRVEQGGLAGPIRADQAGDAAAFDGERNIAVGDHAAERFRDILQFDDGVAHSAPSGCGVSLASTGSAAFFASWWARPPNCRGNFSISQPAMPCWK